MTRQHLPPVRGQGGLRAKLDARSAVCVECHELWTSETLGLLADHIRVGNDEDQEPAATAG